MPWLAGPFRGRRPSLHDQDLIEIAEQQTSLGEPLSLRERLIVAPCGGRFQPLPADVFTSEGEWVEPGSVMGLILDGGKTTEVRSNVRGWVMGMLAFPGHAVRSGEGLFWIRTD